MVLGLACEDEARWAGVGLDSCGNGIRMGGMRIASTAGGDTALPYSLVRYRLWRRLMVRAGLQWPSHVKRYHLQRERSYGSVGAVSARRTCARDQPRQRPHNRRDDQR